MNKALIQSCMGLVFLLCFSLMARGQTPITITGPDPVCVGSSHSYTVPVTPGINYQWTVNTMGSVTSYLPNGTGTVGWGIDGLGILKVYGVDSTGDTTEIGTKNITVLPLPEPVITTDYRVACQSLIPPKEQDLNPQFEDSGCMRTCAYATVTYTASGNPLSTYTWSATGGTVLTTPGNPTMVQWGGPGDGTLTVTETTPEGCVGTRTVCIKIIESPISHFVAMPDTTLTYIKVCDSTDVIFIDKSYSTSSSPIVSWLWDFGDGTYSNAQGSPSAPITHMFPGPGVYTVELTVTNSCGCTTKSKMIVDVQPQVGAKITCVGVMCENGTATYTVDMPCTPAGWSVIGGTILWQNASTVQIQWGSPVDGIGYVMYDPSGCGYPCPQVAVAKVPIIPTTGNIIGDVVICPDKEYLYKLPQWPSTLFNWNLSPSLGSSLYQTDQPNEIVIKTGTTPGMVTLTCNYTNTLHGCSGTATLNIMILDPEEIVGPDKACLNTNGTMYYLGAGNVGNWVLTYPDGTTQVFGSGNSFTNTSLFDQIGLYVLTVTGTTFCPPDPMYIRVDDLPPTPNAINGPTTICRGVPVEYVGDGPLPGTILAWGALNGTLNAATGNSTYLTLSTSSPSVFGIWLWRETKGFPYCKSDSIWMDIYEPVINPVISGDPTPCVNTFVGYSSSYTDGETYIWSVVTPGMGSVQMGQNTPNVTILWNNASGPAYVVCTMTKCFNTYVDTIAVYVSPPFPGTPSISALPNPVCVNSAITVTASGWTGSVAWDFGEGIPFGGTGLVENYTYTTQSTSATNYWIKATFANPSGCGDTYTDSIMVTVNPAPKPLITPPGPIFDCAPFTNYLTPSDDPMYVGSTGVYNWVENGVSMGTFNPYPASNYGYYVASAVSTFGCVGYSDTVWIYEDCGGTACSLTFTPTVGITASLTGCAEVTATGTASSFGLVAGSTSFDYWPKTYNSGGINVPTLSSASGTNPRVFTFQHAAVYTMAYKALYFDGTNYCWFITATQVTVPYWANLNVTEGCAVGGLRPVTVTWTGNQVGSSVTSFQYWDGSSWTAPTGSSSYTFWVPYTGLPVNYGIRVNGTSFPCEAYQNFTASAPTVANFTHARPVSCIKEATVMFNNTSTGATTALWSFGDGTQNTQWNPVKVYDAMPMVGSIYNVNLVVTDAQGCTDAITRKVRVIKDQLKGTLNATPNNVCEGTPVTLQYVPNGGFFLGDNYLWNEDDNLFAITTTPSINVFTSGYYSVDVDDQYGCVDYPTPVVVNVIEVPPAEVWGDPDQCVDVDYTLSGYAGNIPGLTYQWYDNSGAIPGANGPEYTTQKPTPGTYDYWVEITIPKPGGGFCSQMSAMYTVTVHPTPPTPYPFFNVMNCNPYVIELQVSPSLPGTYNWSNGASGNPVYVPQGGPYQVTYTDVFGCESKGTLNTPKHPDVYMWIFPKGCYSLCRTSSYDITGPIIPFTYWEYQQNGAPWITGSWYIPTLVTINTTGTYNLFLDNGYCTALSGDMVVNFYGCDKNKEGDNTSSENGNDENNSMAALSEGDMLTIVPNPAQNSTRINFRFEDNGMQHTLEVYDVLGRKLNSMTPPVSQGSWHLQLDGYLPGIYQVVLREGDKVLLQSRLNVLK